MFKSFGKASSSKANVVDNSPRNEKEFDVQVEVSLDVFDKLYSIVVTENAALQSVVSVPTAETLSRHRKNQKISTGTKMSSRSSGALRPSVHSSKSIPTLPITTNLSRGHDRESSSCPPPMNRGSSEKPPTPNLAPRNRETSCPPPSVRSSDVEGKKAFPAPSNAAIKSKDLVSKTALRGRLFGTRRKSQVVPTARI
jgi:hypothetical protein